MERISPSSMASSTNSDQNSPYMTSSMLSRTSSSSSSAVGEYIGTESCFDVLSADEENDVVSSKSEHVNRFRYGGRRREEREERAKAAREFPPPIPLLAQTANLLPHMPWVLKRVVTSDGRLILREEKVRHHDYFRADRSNGRLTLHLVPLDDDVFELPQEPSHYQTDADECGDDVAEDVSEGVVISGSNDDDENKGIVCSDNDDDGDGCREGMLAEETVVESGVMVGGGGGSPRGKCLKSCFVDTRVREIRQVLS